MALAFGDRIIRMSSPIAMQSLIYKFFISDLKLLEDLDSCKLCLTKEYSVFDY